jgi:phosphoribosylamine--glycine ligase
VLHAGTAPAPDGTGIVSSGGRVLSVVGVGADLAAARAVAYEAVELIDLEGGRFRRDIALTVATGSRATDVIA